MERAYRVSLFYIAGIAIIILIILVASYLNGRKTSIPPENQMSEEYFPTQQISENSISSIDEIAIINQQIHLTSNCLISYIDHYLDCDVCSEKTKIPEEMIGFDKDNVNQFFKEALYDPNEVDVKKGYYDCGILRFSSSEIVLERFYSTEKIDYFYLGIVNDYVIVFCEDQKTIYLNTGILSTKLPQDVLNEIQDFKLICGIEELFDFLEAYTS